MVRETARVKLRENSPERFDLKIDPGSGHELQVEGRAKNSVMRSDALLAVASDLANNELMIVDVPNKKLLRTIAVGKAPYGIAFIRHCIAPDLMDNAMGVNRVH